MTDARHHRASREIILVPVPFEIGSPKEAQRGKPGPYKRDQHQPWRPATRPPTKAEKLAKFLERVNRQDQEIREFMRHARAAS